MENTRHRGLYLNFDASCHEK
ncbi:MAG TPA: hypothetical protein DD706_09040 [Nitrospiraceae bacterium]|nr:hypothetical protein [Nitrospiraceae bacterium]